MKKFFSLLVAALLLILGATLSKPIKNLLANSKED